MDFFQTLFDIFRYTAIFLLLVQNRETVILHNQESMKMKLIPTIAMLQNFDHLGVGEVAMDMTPNNFLVCEII